ncbi:hypothetical protein [Kitasatospora sp. NPDC050543]|uniref:hypothetical protein n=1 Tax=Kitasatospora sp. NPDC050543 TaxID=3364054 RepID=UPI0037B838EC
METTTMITKLTGQTVNAASLCAAPVGVLAPVGTLGTSIPAALVRREVVLAEAGLVLDATGVSVAAVVSALGNTGGSTTGVTGSFVETGLSGDWAPVGESRDMRDERPTQASKAAVAAAKHGDYARVIGAGNAQKQNEQQINQVKAAFIGASAIRMRAFRGPEPWRERT